MSVIHFTSHHGWDNRMIGSLTRSEAIGMIFDKYKITTAIMQNDTRVISNNVGLINYYKQPR